MNKKIILILIFIITFSLCVSSVCAVDLYPKNFGKDFSIKVPKNANFVKDEGEMNEDEFMKMKMVQYSDESNRLVLLYVDSSMISDESVNWWYSNMFDYMNPNLDEYLESQDGNTVFMRSEHSSEQYVSLMGIHEGNKTLMILGQNNDVIEAMGHSVKFN